MGVRIRIRGGIGIGQGWAGDAFGHWSLYGR